MLLIHMTSAALRLITFKFPFSSNFSKKISTHKEFLTLDISIEKKLLSMLHFDRSLRLALGALGDEILLLTSGI